ncbi:MAG: ABA4-like family protein [Cyanobacteriota bacterium]|nr:ABA4-like family protein [Cyanobacteriota bacterium]
MTELIFNLANRAVLPFWGAMIFLPNWRGTRWLLGSLVPLALLACVYLYFFVLSTLSLSPESLEALAGGQLKDLAQAFSNETVMATGWTHYLVMDLFVGRWIYWQGQEKGIWVFHSLALCLFAGPLGVLSHLITATLTERLGNRAPVTLTDGASAP